MLEMTRFDQMASIHSRLDLSGALLGRRTVLYRHHHLTWECTEGFCDETLGSWPRHEKRRNNVRRMAITMDRLTDERENLKQ